MSTFVPPLLLGPTIPHAYSPSWTLLSLRVAVPEARYGPVRVPILR